MPQNWLATRYLKTNTSYNPYPETEKSGGNGKIQILIILREKLKKAQSGTVFLKAESEAVL